MARGSFVNLSRKLVLLIFCISLTLFVKMQYPALKVVMNTRPDSQHRDWWQNTVPGLDHKDLELSLKYDYEEQHKCESFQSRVHDRQSNRNTKGKEICKNVNSCKRFPSFIVIGCRKCGTTALRDFLWNHPNLSTKAGENNFFLQGIQPQNYRKYLKQMPFATPQQLTFHKGTMFLERFGMVNHSPRWIHEFNPAMKLVLIVRDPVRRMESLYWQIKYKLPQKLEETFKQEVISKDGKLRLESTLFNMTNYLHALKRWLCYFPRKQILILDGETLVQNPVVILKQVEQFVELKPYFTESMFSFNETKGFYCSNLQGGCLLDNRGRKYTKMEQDVKLKLMKYMKPMVEEFFKLAGVKFDWDTYTNV